MAKDAENITTSNDGAEDTSKNVEKPIRFNFDMPKELHQAMKIHCVKSGQSMTDFVLELIKEKLS